ncbi:MULTISPECIES: hypothetical protein [Sphingomonas]|jgi:hypothetical protein|uniref:Uncharacterized protein n=1 Tax=Sphingomonas zeae TaxID=1646122 RepID=A0A7Y6EGT4_9SPHN|nr:MULTISPECIES: hypothetical protein [Sphingomonas]MBB4047909.1 hypothetical protein [Sphingomonas zeae]MDK8185008.1 hypothetical protein [Sphingomonas zeae]MDK8215880.1 hypothetical protein [Sphingomonas sp. UMB7805-LC452B]NUU47183.1 hypothetical protein [Sphingomonas zeae]
MPKIGLVLALLCAATSAHAKGADTYSWGKPGASREAFDGGSRACMLQAARRDVTGDGSTQRYVRGARVLEREANTPPRVPTDDIFTQSERQVLLRRMYNPDKQVDALQTTLQSEVDQCLVKAGYVRFTLTREQARTLKRYRPGTEQRKAYLYALGSDAGIVEAQKVAN